MPYNRTPVKLSALLVPALLAGLASTTVAQPKGAAPAKAPKACGVTAIPLVVGNEWTYEPIPLPPERTLSDAQIRLTPPQPKKLVIKVTGIETKEDVTTVTLNEDHDGRVQTSTIRCTAGGGTFSMNQEAFWFAGEPGKSYGIELEDIERKGQTLALSGGKIVALEWHDDLKAKWKRVATGKAAPKFRKGTLEVIRHWVVLPEEKLEIRMGEMAGQQLKTLKLGLETTVKVTIDPPPADPLKAPPLLVNFFWMLDGTGPIQIMNSYGQQFLLTHFVSN